MIGHEAMHSAERLRYRPIVRTATAILRSSRFTPSRRSSGTKRRSCAGRPSGGMQTYSSTATTATTTFSSLHCSRARNLCQKYQTNRSSGACRHRLPLKVHVPTGHSCRQMAGHSRGRQLQRRRHASALAAAAHAVAAHMPAGTMCTETRAHKARKRKQQDGDSSGPCLVA